MAFDIFLRMRIERVLIDISFRALLVDCKMIGESVISDLSMELETVGIIDGVDGFQLCFSLIRFKTVK